MKHKPIVQDKSEKLTTKHTAGPWRVSGCCFIRQDAIGKWMHEPIIAHGNEEEINPSLATVNCRVHCATEREANKPDQETLANARLISAAPDMLEALKEADRMLDIAGKYFPKSIRNTDKFSLLNVQANSVKKAIAKAEGN
jgi:hypothetical protein